MRLRSLPSIARVPRTRGAAVAAVLALATSIPAAASATGAAAGRAASAGPALRPVVRTAVRHDVSRPLRSMTPLRPAPGTKLRVIPNPNPLRDRIDRASPATTHGRTSGVQRTAGPHTMPAFGQNFEGIDFGAAGDPCQCLPPDTNLAVGPSEVVQAVNTSFAVWSKTGTLLFGPVDLGTIWQGLGGACDPLTDSASYDGGDIIVMFDEQANRWFISQLAFPGIGSGGFHNCIAVSQTGDATGAWFRYDFLASSAELNDYPKFAVWPDAYYLTVNDFADGGNGNFTGVTAVAFNRAAMLAGQQATEVMFTSTNPSYASLLPSNWEGGALGEQPPAGAPDPFWMSCDAHTGGPCSSGQLDEWDFHVDWSNPASSTFGNNGAPNLTLPTQDFNGNLCDFDQNCIPQPGTSQGVDPHADAVMYQAAFRDIGGTQHVVLSQTVNAGADAPGGTQAGINWYDLTDAGSGWAIADQGTYSPDASARFQPSANIDVSGDLAVGYSVSSSSVFPSIRVAGRLAADPAGQLAQGEATLIAGGGSQTSTFARWGDYSAMQVDPADGCTFWYTTEYYAATADVAWQTRIGSFSYPSCSFTHGTLSGTVTDAATGRPVAGATVTADGVSVTTGAGGSYSFDLPPGATQVTASDYGFQTQTQTVTITANQTTTQNFALTGTPHETVSGTVTPATGTAWPLYAHVSWSDGQGHDGTAFTSPATGKYALSLLANASYTLTVHVEYPGYTDPAPANVTVATSDVTQDFTAGVDLLACTAIGYHQVLSGITQPFSQTSVPPGWQVTNANLHIPYYQSQPGWQLTNPGRRPNNTGGTGNFAIVDSDHAGQFHYQDTELITPVTSFAADRTPVVEFNTDYQPAVNSTAAVGLSADGGRTWASIWTSKGFPGQPGPATVVIQVPQAAGKSNIRVRFGFTGQWSQWWEIDNVFLGNRVCTQQTGGLLTGRVADAAGNAINGATVASVANPAENAVTMATPGDSAINDGLYDLFVTETGSQQYTASATGRTTSTQSVTITAGQTTTLNFTLAP